MKKTVLALTVLMLFLLSGCEWDTGHPADESETVQLKDEPETIQLTDELGEDWTLEMTVEDVGPTGATVVFTHKGDGVMLTTGEPYSLEKYTDGEWKELNTWDDAIFTAIGLMIPNNDSRRLDTDWKYLYGVLSEGRYRIAKDVRIEGVRFNEYEGIKRTENYIEDKTFYGEFTIEYISEEREAAIKYASEYLKTVGTEPIIESKDSQLIFTYEVGDSYKKHTAEDMRAEWEIYKMLRDNSTFYPFSYYSVRYVSPDGELMGGGGSTVPCSRHSSYAVLEKDAEGIASDIGGIFSESLLSEYLLDCTVEDKNSVRLCLRETESVYAYYNDLEYIYGLLKDYYKQTGLASMSYTELYDVNGECVAVICGDVECGKFSVWFEDRFSKSFADKGYGPVRV